MTDSFDLTGLDSNSFEQMVNMLVIRILGAGATGFGPGPDGGRDGYFRGTAPYPSNVETWTGIWYIQSKFHKPHLSKDPQKWLIGEIKKEIKKFQDEKSNRSWPDNWIIATNIDLSGAANTGSFDVINKLVKEAHPSLSKHTHVWGGRKLLDFLALHSEVSDYYRHFLTPGHILTSLFEQANKRPIVNRIIRHLAAC